jgi:hypothetical protein
MMRKVEVPCKTEVSPCGLVVHQCSFCDFWTLGSEERVLHYVSEHLDLEVRTYKVQACTRPNKVHWNETYPCWRGTTLTDLQLRAWQASASACWRVVGTKVKGSVVEVVCKDRLARKFYCCLCAREKATELQVRKHLGKKHFMFFVEDESPT